MSSYSIFIFIVYLPGSGYCVDLPGSGETLTNPGNIVFSKSK